MLFLKNCFEIRAAQRLSHPKANRRGAARSLQLDATKILRHQQLFAVDICPIQLSEITEDVLNSPRKLRAKTASEVRVLTTQTQLEFADGPELPDLIITALADTASEVASVIGMELLKGACDSTPRCQNSIDFSYCGQGSLAGGTQGVTVTLTLPVIASEGYKVFKCLNLFVHASAVVSWLIPGYPFLLAFGLAVVPGQEALVQVRGCSKRFPVRQYQHGKPQSVQQTTSAVQIVEATHRDSKKRGSPRTDTAHAVDQSSGVQNSGVLLVPQRNGVQFATEVSHQWCIESEDPCSGVHCIYDVQQLASCEQCGPVYKPVGVLHERREGVRRNVLSIVLPATLDDETAMSPIPDPPKPEGIPGTRSQPMKLAAGLHVYPSPAVYEDDTPPLCSTGDHFSCDAGGHGPGTCSCIST